VGCGCGRADGDYAGSCVLLGQLAREPASFPTEPRLPDEQTGQSAHSPRLSAPGADRSAGATARPAAAGGQTAAHRTTAQRTTADHRTTRIGPRTGNRRPRAARLRRPSRRAAVAAEFEVITGRCLRPKGASGNSPRRKPWDHEIEKPRAPKGRHTARQVPPLRGSMFDAFGTQGLRPGLLPDAPLGRRQNHGARRLRSFVVRRGFRHF
jgi:hypothetical protein